MTDASRQGAAVARATVDVSSYVVPVSKSHVLDMLRRRLRTGERASRFADTLELETPAGFRDTHPVVVESWRVRGGAILTWGVEQDVWVRQVGSMWGALAALGTPVSWRAAWSAATRGGGLSAENAAPAFDAASAELMRGAIAGAALGARSAQALNDLARTRFGRYGEVSVFVPFVRVAPLPTHASFVAGMHTDSRFAQTIDRMLGYGFVKQHGRITHDEHGLRVDSAAGRCQLRTCDERVDASLPLDLPGHWELPLLGLSPAGGLVTSRLTRSASATGFGLHAALETHEGWRWLLPDARYRVEPATRDCIVGGTFARDVTFELSTPRNLH